MLDFACVGNHGLKLQGFLNANQEILRRTLPALTAAGSMTPLKRSMVLTPTTSGRRTYPAQFLYLGALAGQRQRLA